MMTSAFQLYMQEQIRQANIKCDIYLGDAQSTSLFYIGLNPLRQIIAKSGYGYQFHSGGIISHLLCMDDIKLFAKNEQDIISLIHFS